LAQSTKKTGSGSSAKKTNTTGKRSQTTKKQAEPEKTFTMPRIRISHRAWCVILCFISFIAILSFFNVEGFMINWYKSLVTSLFGYGYYIMPFCLIASAVVLFTVKKKGGRGKIVCFMLLPLLVGAVRHLITDTADYPFKWESFKALASGGKAFTSGGVLSGWVAVFLRSAISRVGAVIVLLICTGVALIGAIKPNFKALGQRIANFRMRDDDIDYVPDRSAERKAKEAEEMRLAKLEARQKAPGRRRTTVLPTSGIDVALEGPENTASPIKRGGKLRSQPGDGIDIDLGQASKMTDDELRDFAKQLSAAPIPASEWDDIPPAPEAVEEVYISAPAAPGLPETPVHRPASASVMVEPEPDDDEIPPFDLDEPLPVHQTNTDLAPASKMPEPTEPDEEDVASILAAAAAKGPAPDYVYPPISLLAQREETHTDPAEEMKKYSQRLVSTLSSFNIEAQVIGITRGPTVTRYELLLRQGTKYARVVGLSDDIALALGAPSVRVSMIPDKNAIGIEVPNDHQQMVTLREVIDSPQFKSSRSKLSFGVGKGISGECVVGDIATMPHMLVAGTTGSGKSVCINSIIISLLYRSSPKDVRLIMVDPKMIELGVYNGIPHLLIPVVTDPKKASGALHWAVTEMMKRYKLFAEAGARDLRSYNSIVEKKGEGEPLPQIVIIIDELADLMFVAQKEVEEAIVRIAQMARAAGMHLIIATQRPSSDVITGIMKANIPSRIAFAVSSQLESRIILDTMGAEKLIGKGDMLYSPLGAQKPARVQGSFISTAEVENVVNFVKQTGEANYSEEVMQQIERAGEAGAEGGGGGGDDPDDELINDAIDIVVRSRQASVSMLQRHLKLGYSRAARLMDQMESRGIVGPSEGSKPRQVLIGKEDWAEMKLRQKY